MTRDAISVSKGSLAARKNRGDQMPSRVPYTASTGKLQSLLERIPKTSVPPKVDQKWLSQLGFSSSNDHRMIPILRYIGFVNSSGVPTDAWKDYRVREPGTVLARGIREGYSELFSVFPNAPGADTDALTAFFSGEMGLGDKAVGYAVATFKTLTRLADFSGEAATIVVPASHHSDESDTNFDRDKSRADSHTPNHSSPGASLTVNVNLQLTLPETTDSAVYDALFSALSRHVLSRTTGDA